MAKLSAPELIAPAGNWPCLKAAINAGADAAYFGVKDLNMRANAQNFETTELRKVMKELHDNNLKGYLTLNTILFEGERDKADKILEEAGNAEIDGVHFWDMSLIELCKKHGIEMHLSTQASVSNSAAARFYERQGVSRIILAREVSLEQVKKIKEEAGKLELEAFVHGAMCVSVSGRCFLSHYLYGKSANRGECMQPCRREYYVKGVEEGEELLLGKDYVLSPKDMCSLPFIDKLIEAGINAFKIEGRIRPPEYVKEVTESYRSAIDAVIEGSFDEELVRVLLKKVEKVYNRGFSPGFWLGLPTSEDYALKGGSHSQETKMFVGTVKKYYKKVGAANIRVNAGSIEIGDELIVLGNKTGIVRQKVESMEFDHEPISNAVKGQSAGIKFDQVVRENDEVYKVVRNEFIEELKQRIERYRKI